MRSKDVPSRVAIVGGGYAGLAAAVRLSQANIRCTVFETGKVAGGRARRITYQGHVLDNGQHLLIGAYTSLLDLMKTVGVPADCLLRIPLTLNMHPGFALRAPRLPSPFNLAWGLLTAKGLSWPDRFAAARLSRLVQAPSLPPGLAAGTVQDLLEATRQPQVLVEAMWAPLCIAALNTPLSMASASVFAQVMRDALFVRSEYSDFLLPTVDLSALFPEPAGAWLQARGSSVRLQSRVRQINRLGTGFGLTISESAGQPVEDPFDAVICAAGPHQLRELESQSADIQAALAVDLPTQFEPICTIYLGYPCAVPFGAIMLGRRTGMSQWFFDRSRLGAGPGLVAAVVSASGPHGEWSQAEIAARAHEELCELVGPLPQPDWHKVIEERFATFACTTSVTRPPNQSPLPGLVLAGDYTAGPYPATLEGAVRSGEAAASHILHFLKSSANHERNAPS